MHPPLRNYPPLFCCLTCRGRNTTFQLIGSLQFGTVLHVLKTPGPLTRFLVRNVLLDTTEEISPVLLVPLLFSRVRLSCLHTRCSIYWLSNRGLQSVPVWTLLTFFFCLLLCVSLWRLQTFFCSPSGHLNTCNISVTYFHKKRRKMKNLQLCCVMICFF